MAGVAEAAGFGDALQRQLGFAQKGLRTLDAVVGDDAGNGLPGRGLDVVFKRSPGDAELLRQFADAEAPVRVGCHQLRLLVSPMNAK